MQDPTRDRMARLYEAHHAELTRFVAGRDPDNADSVCARVWAAAAEALHDHRLVDQPRAWLFGVARNKLADVPRRARLQDPLGPDTLSRRLAEQGAVAEMRLAGERGDLARALATLSEAERELFCLRWVDGLKPAEIAAMEGQEASPNAVSARLVRIARRLRGALAPP